PEPPAVTIATWPTKRPGMWALDDPVAPHGGLVELEPETGPLRCDELAVLDPRHRSEDAGRARHVLDHVSVGDGGQQMHLNFRDHVAADGYPMCLREPGDLPPGHDAADPGQVEDDEVDGPRLQQGAKRVEMIEVLAGGDRHFEPAAKIGEPGHVRVVNRILQPRDAGVLQNATRPARPGQRPALDGVDHDAN